MGLIEAIIIGIVQGLTEFLPISSSGHIFLTERLFGIEQGAGFTAVIQLGTLLAVLIYFRKDITGFAQAFLRGVFDRASRDTPGFRLSAGIAVGTIPIAVAGLALEGPIDREFRSPFLVAATLIILALILLAAERFGTRARDLQSVTIWDGFVVGLWQAIALVPGSSRSGCTITGALFRGFDRFTAARFSFLLSIPAVALSGGYKLAKDAPELLGTDLVPVIIATLVSFITGYLAIAFLMSFLQRRSTLVFVWYRVILGMVVLALASSGYLGST